MNFLRRTDATEFLPPSSLPLRRQPRLALALGLTGALLAGCTAEVSPPSTTASAARGSQEAEPLASIPVFSDIQFSNRIGQVAGYNIICVYRKNKENHSIHPKNVRAYWVSSSDLPTGASGFVDPNHAGIVGGMAPECDTHSEAPAVPTPIPPDPADT